MFWLIFIPYFGSFLMWSLEGVCQISNDDDPSPLVFTFSRDSFENPSAFVLVCRCSCESNLLQEQQFNPVYKHGASIESLDNERNDAPNETTCHRAASPPLCVSLQASPDAPIDTTKEVFLCLF